jgi:taurine dioxygenase
LSSGEKMSQAPYRQIDVKPLSGALGAEVSGLDLAEALGEGTLAEVRRAFADHLVLVFRDQSLSPGQQVGFARNFGPITKHPFVKTLADHPEVLRIARETDEIGSLNFGGVWHSDVPFLDHPPLGSTLYAVEIPPYGGDTLFANLCLAYEGLSDGLKATAACLKLVHAVPTTYDPDTGPIGSMSGGHRSIQVELNNDRFREAVHPLVRVIPQTGRQALFVTGDYGDRFEGWTASESKPLLDFFQQHVTRPEFTCRVRWTKGALTMWDNRCTQHFAINDYPGFRRVMHRVQIEGERPISADDPAASAKARA